MGLCSRAVLKEILDRWCHFQPSGSILGFLPFQEFSRTSKFIQEIMVSDAVQEGFAMPHIIWVTIL